MDFPDLNKFPYINTDSETRDIIQDISICRDKNCTVPKKHPFYPTPNQPPFYYGKRPCMPVVPTNLAVGKVMIIGEYPNCRFGAVVDPDGNLEKSIPVGDINEPFEGGRYFDGMSVRGYPTESELQRHYLAPLGLNLREDVWLTNVVKCFLMLPKHIDRYQKVGWNTPTVKDTFSNDDDYLGIASVCVQRHLRREVEKCQPKLIIVVGEKAYRMVHAKNDFAQPADDILQKDLVGKIFKANQQNDPLDQRDSLFLGFNVAHLYHPSFLARRIDQIPDGNPPELIEHQGHIGTVKDFMGTLGL